MKPPHVSPTQSAQTTLSSEPSDATPNVTQPQQTATIADLTAQSMPQHQAATLTAPSTNTISVPQQRQQPSTPPNLGDANMATQPIITTQAIVVLKPTSIGSHPEQQAPLALTTQPQSKLCIQTSSTIQIQQQQSNPIGTSNSITMQPQPSTPTSKDTNNLTRTNPATTQALITSQANIVAKTTTINPQQEQQAPLALITQPQNKPAPTPATSSPTPPIQQQPPKVPITNPTANVKQEPSVCCLLDNGVRCERVAGNASFSARIQKIVASKKMNFALDPVVRHTYICDHHKAVITVAKKSVPTARETKAAARNLAAAAANNVNAGLLPNQHLNSYNDIAINQPSNIQHPVNMEIMASQGRLANNHAGMLISMPLRPGTQIAYGHYGAGPHPNQVGRIEPTIMTSSSFDNTGGDNVASSSGGIEVDLQQLQVNTLRRYKRHFRVQTRPGLNKMQLAESLKHHFRTLPIIEKEAITYFVYIVKSSRNKLDHNPKAD